MAAGSFYGEHKIIEPGGVFLDSHWGERKLIVDKGPPPIRVGGGCIVDTFGGDKRCTNLPKLPPRWLTWIDKYHLTMAVKPSVIQVGSDTVLKFAARSFADGDGPTLLIDIQSSSVKIAPTKSLMLPTKPDSESFHSVVLTPDSIGEKKLLVQVRILEKVYPDWVTEGLEATRGKIGKTIDLPSKTARLESDFAAVETFELKLSVKPRTFMGFTKESLQIVQIISGAIGLPALVLAWFTWVVKRRNKRKGTPSIILTETRK